jgi:bifunctional UDP-N-acetylglucosamine pyrophosphorylase/glucosamine-1-phosphate N-acetyltransferase
VTAPVVVVMAAGQGTRMRSRTPKVLHDVCGRPMVGWPIAAAQEAGAQRVVVVGGPDRALEGHLPPGVLLAVQPVSDGTGGAVLAAADHIDRDAPVVILSGDVPLVTPATVAGLVQAHVADGAVATMVTTVLDDPTGYGRVVRAAGGAVERVVETKAPGDAAADELAIHEVNTGIFCFDGGALLDALARVGTDNAQGERYLPDVIPILRADGGRVGAYVADDPNLVHGVNDQVHLAQVRAIAQAQIVERHQRAGVSIVDPGSTLIEVGVQLGQDTVVEPATFLRGTTRVGEDARLGPLTTIVDSVIGDGCSVVHSYVTGATMDAGATIGPFAYLRPGAHLREKAKAGTFVEIKNSDIGAGTKVPHLSYIGDADVGAGSNLGAGTITANYDGRHKHRTTIGAGVKGGVHTSFVAPVAVGDDAYTAAGSVVTEDVPAGALAVARSRQRNIEGYAERVRQAVTQEP